MPEAVEVVAKFDAKMWAAAVALLAGGVILGVILKPLIKPCGCAAVTTDD
jgi:hypothetical protein